MKNKGILKFLIIIVSIILCITLIILLKQRKPQQIATNTISKAEEETENLTFEPVKSATAYFTVQNCIAKYFNYIQAQNAEAIYTSLSDEYIEKNQVTLDNVLSKIQTYEDQVIYQAREIYLEQTSDEIGKYYAIGSIMKVELLEDTNAYKETLDENACFEVELNYKDMTFAITPIEFGRDS